MISLYSLYKIYQSFGKYFFLILGFFFFHFLNSVLLQRKNIVNIDEVHLANSFLSWYLPFILLRNLCLNQNHKDSLLFIPLFYSFSTYKNYGKKVQIYFSLFHLTFLFACGNPNFLALFFENIIFSLLNYLVLWTDLRALRIHILNSTFRCDDIWRWGLWGGLLCLNEVLRLGSL